MVRPKPPFFSGTSIEDILSPGNTSGNSRIASQTTISQPATLRNMPRGRVRCWWADGGDALYAAYHDEEWGVPQHDDRKLFEMLLLEGFQAGLSWITILRKRENFRRAFRDFDAEIIVRFKKRDLERLMQDAGIVRNRLKVEGSVLNARAFLAAKDEFGSFDKFIWQFTGGNTLRKPG